MVSDIVDCQNNEIRFNSTRRSDVTINSDSIGTEGIVQVCRNGKWGDVCDSFSSFTARDVCQKANYSDEG